MPDFTQLNTDDLIDEYINLCQSKQRAADSFENLGKHVTKTDDNEAREHLESFDEPLSAVKRELISRGLLAVITG